MVRITTEEDNDSVVWRVEGSLREPWVAELEKLWQGAGNSGRHLCLSLQDVPYIDDAARALIMRMYRNGVEISATGLYVSAILRDIQARCAAVPSAAKLQAKSS